MSLNNEQIYVEPSIASVNLPPLNSPGKPSWATGLGELAEYCKQVGVRNAEVHPNEKIVQECIDDQDPSMPDYPEIEFVGSIHETFNTGEGMLGKMLDRQGIMRSEHSLAGATRIAQALGRRVVLVNYVHEGKQRFAPTPLNRSNETFFNVVQPSAEVVAEFNLNGTTEKLIRVMLSHEMEGLCPDTGWARADAANGAKVPPGFAQEKWDEQHASGSVFQQHVSLGRYDLLGYSRKVALSTMKDLSLFVSKNWQNALRSETGEMIGRGIQNWQPPESLVREVGFPLLRQVIETPPGVTARSHRRIAENLAHIADHYGAQPLLYGDPNPTL